MDNRDCPTKEADDNQSVPQLILAVLSKSSYMTWENIDREWKAVFFGVSLLLLAVIRIPIPW